MELTPRWVDALTESGHEAVHWSAIGLHNAPDSAISSLPAIEIG
jgi:predicted nuclease of predicted toxin-antitoxin system